MRTRRLGRRGPTELIPRQGLFAGRLQSGSHKVK